MGIRWESVWEYRGNVGIGRGVQEGRDRIQFVADLDVKVSCRSNPFITRHALPVPLCWLCSERATQITRRLGRRPYRRHARGLTFDRFEPMLGRVVREEIMARFLVLPSHIVSSILGAGSWLLCPRALTADEPPTAQAVMVSPVTLSPGGCDPSTAPPQLTPTSSTSSESSE